MHCSTTRFLSRLRDIGITAPSFGQEQINERTNRSLNRSSYLGMLLLIAALKPCTPTVEPPLASSLDDENPPVLHRQGRKLTECHYDYRLSRTQVGHTNNEQRLATIRLERNAWKSLIPSSLNLCALCCLELFRIVLCLPDTFRCAVHSPRWLSMDVRKASSGCLGKHHVSPSLISNRFIIVFSRA
jgi:hypothetical protein